MNRPFSLKSWLCMAAMAALLCICAQMQARAQEQEESPPVSQGENFSAKPAPALFQSDCTGAGCHKGPQGLARGQSLSSLAAYLREHYTNSRESAAALAAYLSKIPAAHEAREPREPREARTPRPARPNTGGPTWAGFPGFGEPAAEPKAEPRNESRRESKGEPKGEAKREPRSTARPPHPTARASRAATRPEGEMEDRTPRTIEPKETAAEPKETAEQSGTRATRGKQPPTAVTPPPAPQPAPAAAAAPPPKKTYDIFD